MNDAVFAVSGRTNPARVAQAMTQVMTSSEESVLVECIRRISISGHPPHHSGAYRIPLPSAVTGRPSCANIIHRSGPASLITLMHLVPHEIRRLAGFISPLTGKSGTAFFSRFSLFIAFVVIFSDDSPLSSGLLCSSRRARLVSTLPSNLQGCSAINGY